MRALPWPRWLPVVILAALALAATRPAQAAPARQQEFSISVVAFIDVAPATDPDCPGCNGDFDAEDSDYAQNTPLPPMDFLVKDSTDTVLAQQTTTELVPGIQRTSFTVPEGPAFTVELVSAPPDWQLCPNETAVRHLDENSFQLGNAREEFHFTQGCTTQGETPTPTETPLETATPGGPTVTPMAGQPTATPGGSKSTQKDRPALGYIKGFACIDLNGNGKVDPNDPGLNDVRVKVSGGSSTFYAVTPGTGNYSFDGLGAGTYEVSISVGPEWRVTTPTMYTVKLAEGQVSMGNDFCMVRVEAPVKAPMAVIAGRGIRLPATGFADLPALPLLGMATLILGALGALGMSAERRRHGRQDD